MKKLLICILLVSSVVLYAQQNDGTAFIASYNAKRLGNGTKNYPVMAKLLSKCDIVGIIEVMNQTGIDDLIYALMQETNEPWMALVSDRSAGSVRYREYFAYVYKKNRISLVRKFGFYKEIKESDFAREPYGAEFQVDKYKFTFVLCHIIWGTDEKRRDAEIKLLPKVYTYFQNINGSENNVYIAGDFNMEPIKPCWSFVTNSVDGIHETIKQLQKTTVGANNLVSSYDNILLSKYSDATLILAGVLNIPGTMDKATYRDTVSDHLPVYIIIRTELSY
jgi:endonuclease/exonuclease/phosphatase family metal-dependent hydrolase